MRLFEAIVDANHRALSGDSGAGLHPDEHQGALPVVALTCIDPRLNRLLPECLGVRDEDFIWLRNAGNIIFDSSSGIMRSLALACAVKGGKEIAIIGHTDCRVGCMSVNQLIECFRALGIARSNLPDNFVEFFGLFASERQNVINGVEHVRRSRLISPRTPVHGLLLNIENGRLEWVVNGYEHRDAPVHLPTALQPLEHLVQEAQEVIGAVKSLATGEIKLPDIKIGELPPTAQHWLSEVQVLEQKAQQIASAVHQAQKGASAPPAAPPIPAKPYPVPTPPQIRLTGPFLKKKKK